MKSDITLDSNKICFITCVNDEVLYSESLKYIDALDIPHSVVIEKIAIRNADNMLVGYNQAMKETNAKFKVYLHQDTFIVNKSFITEVMSVFGKNEDLGLIGMIGAKKIPVSCKWWEGKDKYGKVIENSLDGTIRKLEYSEILTDYEEVQAVDGFLMVTQYDILWREDLLDGWHFYDVSQSLEFLHSRYKVGVINQIDRPWCVHDSGALNLTGYEEQRNNFTSYYSKQIFPLVSILIPTYNRPKYFIDALESALGQTYKNIEIIVCDDSTNEETLEAIGPYIEEYSSIIKYYKNNENLGQFDNDLKCLDLADGEYINFLMDDDLYHPSKIEKMMKYYLEDTNNEIKLVTSHRQLINEKGVFLEDWNSTKRLFNEDTIVDGIAFGEFLLKNTMNAIGEPTTVLFKKKDLIEPFGRFYGRKFKCNVDLATWFNLMCKGKAVYIAETLSYFRIHESQQLKSPNMLIHGAIDYVYLILKSIYKGFFSSEEKYLVSLKNVLSYVQNILQKNNDELWESEEYKELLYFINLLESKISSLVEKEKSHELIPENSYGKRNADFTNYYSKIRDEKLMERKYHALLELVSGLTFSSLYSETITKALVKSALKDDEFKIFNHLSLENIKKLTQNYEDIYIIGHWGNLIKGNMESSSTVITPNKEGRFHPNQLAELPVTNALLTTNIHFANLLLMDKSTLKDISHQITKSIILPFHIPTNKYAVTWSEEFGHYYSQDDQYIRWHGSNDKKGFIEIINNTDEEATVNIRFKSSTLLDKASLVIFCESFIENFQIDTEFKHIDINFLVEPGINRIDFTFEGQGRVLSNRRLYNFSIQNLEIILNGEVLLQKEEAYSLKSIEFDDYYISDQKVRKTLHSNGFFEVESFAFMNNGMFKKSIGTSTFSLPNTFTEIDDINKSYNELLHQGTYSTLVIYRANRYSTFIREESSCDG
ncbi:glycosyltransferase [Paenibacillus provencensis]|uniref:Glycosyltransferase n=1 Tax=Paenibacillus provencensis TaxID=441151 RepID=A0ABW3PT04_9BACL|nr:glycosyltransferase [Paenibacillus sp. MER 78]MCM3128281.1 glycosyltransferase [Paenibacillus sp. MER 78]